MRVIRIVLHGLVLVAAELAGIATGFLLYRPLQPLIALALTALLFAGWTAVLCRLRVNALLLRDSSDFVLTALCAFVWAPSVFLPLHYSTQGYLSSAGNVIALWVFQVPANALALAIPWTVARRAWCEPSTVQPESSCS